MTTNEPTEEQRAALLDLAEHEQATRNYLANHWPAEYKAGDAFTYWRAEGASPTAWRTGTHHEEPYAAIARLVTKLAPQYEARRTNDDTERPQVGALALVTYGWAAPLPNDDSEPHTAPSEHPERRRVRLVQVVEACGALTARIDFIEPETGNSIETVNTTAGRGALTDALTEALAAITENQNH